MSQEPLSRGWASIRLGPAAASFLNRRVIILANLDQIAEDLAIGTVVVIGGDRIRVRRLPMPG